jgi:hypothetical protein
MNDFRDGGRFKTHEENVAYGHGLLDAHTFAKQAVMASMMGSFLVGFIVGSLL